MKIFFAYSGSEVGYGVDQYLNEFVSHLHGRDNEVTVYDVDSNDSKALDEEYETIILADSLSWFINNRLRIKGRPWVCLVSFNFNTMLPYLSMPIPDSGVHAVFSHSSVFVSKCSALTPTLFHWKPVPHLGTPVRKEFMTGCILPNVADRDFCLAAKVYERFKLAKSDFFEIHMPENETKRLPKELDGARVIRYKSGDELGCYERINHLIPTPRITDLRVGAVSPEYIRAIKYGCKPLLMWHPALESLQRVVFSMYDSFSKYMADVDKIIENPQIELIGVSLSDDLTPTTSSLVTSVLSTHQRWKSNANAKWR